MKKKVLILTGSPRVGGNSDLMADSFAEGARKAGHEVTIFNAGRKKIGGCMACDTCFSKGKPCTFNDDFDELAPLLVESDFVAFITPLYFFGFPAQLKAAIDKLYSFAKEDPSVGIKESLIISCGDTEDITDFDGMSISFDRLCRYTGWENKGKYFIQKVGAKKDILKTDALDKTAKMGAALTTYIW